MLRTYTVIVVGLATSLIAQTDAKTPIDSSRGEADKLVEQIKRADYQGDRAALKRLHDRLLPPAGNPGLASRVLYWRGFALWRSAINGFNETPTPTDLQDDLSAAVADFNDSLAKDPSYVEAKIAEGSCYGYLMYLNRKESARMQEYLQHSAPLLKEAMAADPDNPRLLWVLGPIRWSTPPERGGGQDKAFDLYDRGLDLIKNRPVPNDPLEPSWGKPELLMNRAWSNLNRTTPDLKAAEQDAEAALALVPYWHYVKDILLPQIRAAQNKPR